MWRDCEEKKGVALANYHPAEDVCLSGLPCLSLQIGEVFTVLEETDGWYFGFSKRNKDLKGIFPASFMHVSSGRDISFSSCTDLASSVSVDDSLVEEIRNTVLEWSKIWKNRLYMENSSYYTALKKMMEDLMNFRKELLTHQLPQKTKKDIKEKAVAKLDWGNQSLKLDLVPRVSGDHVDADNISPIKLSDVHVECAKRAGNSSSRGPYVVQRKHLTHHLLLKLDDFQMEIPNGDEAVIYFTLYEPVTQKFISERAVCRLIGGAAVTKWEDGGFSALFQDLNDGDMEKDIYLVAYIYHYSGLKGPKKAKTVLYKRPSGCAIVGIQDVLRASRDLKDELKYTMNFSVSNNESEFPFLVDNLIKRKSSVKEDKSKGAALRVIVALRMFHGIFPTLKERNPLIFTRRLTISSKLGFADVVSPEDFRNDFYLTLTKADFLKQNTTSSEKNVEVKILVANNNSLVPNAIFGAAGEPASGDYKSAVFYHANAPKWNEVIRVKLPQEKFMNSHIRLEFRHCPTSAAEKKLFAFAFLKLSEPSGQIVQDGEHELIIYKVGDVEKLRHPAAYLELMWKAAPVGKQAAGITQNTVFKSSSKESILVETLLCSTKLTQNADMLEFFKWKQSTLTIPEILRNFRKNVGGAEVLRLHGDILTSLFLMFMDEGAEEHSRPIYEGLVHILSFLTEPRFEHFLSAFHLYVQDTFSATLVFRHMLDNLCEILEERHQLDRPVGLLASSLKVLELLFKFVVRSAKLFARTSTVVTDKYNSDLVTGVTLFWSNATEFIADSEMDSKFKSLLIESVTKSLEEMIELLPPDQVAERYAGLLQEVDSDDNVVMTAKLRSIKVAMKLQCLLDDAVSRRTVIRLCNDTLAGCFHHTCHHLEHVADILSELLDTIYKGAGTTYTVTDARSVVTPMIDTVVSTILEAKDLSTECSKQLVSCLVTMMKMMQRECFCQVYSKFKSRDSLIVFLKNLLRALRLIRTSADGVPTGSRLSDFSDPRPVSTPGSQRTSGTVSHPSVVYPNDWVVMWSVVNATFVQKSEYICMELKSKFLIGDDFDYELWHLFFHFSVDFMTQPSLQLETFSQLKRDKYFTRHERDMRVAMADLIREMWSELGVHRIKFVPTLVGPFLEASLLPQTELRAIILPLFHDMMQCEKDKYGSVEKTKSEMIQHMDSKITENRGDSAYCVQFHEILIKLMREDPLLHEEGVKDIESISSLLQLLLNYRNFCQSKQDSGNTMIATYKLLQFYNKMERRTLYTKYVYELAALHERAQNFTEAAFALKMVADQLTWSTAELPAYGNFKVQKEWERKQKLCEQILAYFDRGEAWEFGISVCKELYDFYETKLVDYDKVSAILTRQAEFCKKILKSKRIKQVYFHVGFYGMFPTFLKNKALIYKGNALETLSEVLANLRVDFPSAEFVKPGAEVVTEEMKSSDKRYIQPFAVQPVKCEPTHFEESLQTVNDQIRDFYSTNGVSRFQFDTIFHRGTVDKNNDFKTMHMLRRTFRTVSSLPSALPWAEVVDVEQEEFSPLLTAIDAMRTKNMEIHTIIEEQKKEKGIGSGNSLLMALNGVIQATVNGGFENYQSAFLHPGYQEENPEDVQYISDLESAYGDQLGLLRSGLRIYNCIASEEMRPLYTTLAENFKQQWNAFNSDRSQQMDIQHRVTAPTIDRTDESQRSSGYDSSVSDGKAILQKEDSMSAVSTLSTGQESAEDGMVTLGSDLRPISPASGSPASTTSGERNGSAQVNMTTPKRSTTLPARDIINIKTAPAHLPSHGHLNKSHSMEPEQEAPRRHDDEAIPPPPPPKRTSTPAFSLSMNNSSMFAPGVLSVATDASDGPPDEAPPLPRKKSSVGSMTAHTQPRISHVIREEDDSDGNVFRDPIEARIHGDTVVRRDHGNNNIKRSNKDDRKDDNQDDEYDELPPRLPPPRQPSTGSYDARASISNRNSPPLPTARRNRTNTLPVNRAKDSGGPPAVAPRPERAHPAVPSRSRSPRPPTVM